MSLRQRLFLGTTRFLHFRLNLSQMSSMDSRIILPRPMNRIKAVAEDRGHIQQIARATMNLRTRMGAEIMALTPRVDGKTAMLIDRQCRGMLTAMVINPKSGHGQARMAAQRHVWITRML